MPGTGISSARTSRVRVSTWIPVRFSAWMADSGPQIPRLRGALPGIGISSALSSVSMDALRTDHESTGRTGVSQRSNLPGFPAQVRELRSEPGP